MITDLLDDLAGSSDQDGWVFIAYRLLTAVAELIFAMRRCWQSRGKWLLRRLRNADPETCGDLMLGYRRLVNEGDATMLHQVAVAVLDRAGGRMLTGYRREASTQEPRRS